jgi:V8-like Glu-specific endopeptidase
MSQSGFKQQMIAAEQRYASRSSSQRHNETNLSVGGDWRKVETPDRVMRRITSLGLHELASKFMATEDVTQSIQSAIKPDKQVSLLERIIEENDLISSRFLPMGAAVARAVGRITIRQGGRNLGSATGFLVSPELLLTNHHVFETEAMATESFVEFDFFERLNGTTRPTVIHRLQPGQFFLNDRQLDYSLVAVTPLSDEGLSSTDRGFIPLIAQSGKALIGEPVNVIQHPAGAPQQIAIRNNNITDIFDSFLHYAADTEPGSSGSPVFNMQWELAALHHSGVPKRNSQNQILTIDGRVFDERSENVERIAWQANEGVRISSIVQDVQSKLSADSDKRRADLFEAAIQNQLGTISSLGSVLSPPSTERQTTEIIFPLQKYSDEQLDRLTPEEIAEMVSNLDANTLEFSLEATSTSPVLVAEGDSWFDYSPAGLDVISCLKQFFGYNIYNVAKAGDTLDNMAFGTKFDQRRWQRDRPPLEETLAAIEQHRPPVVLLSGGGNDIAGDELLSFLNHKSSGLPPIREDYANFMLKDYFLRIFQHISTEIWKKDPNIHIILHGYGYPIPDGRAVIRILGLSFVGPWLRPPLVAKGYEQRSEQEQIVHRLITDFNDMLNDFAATDPRLHYIDLRPLISDSDWGNELHLNNSSYRRVAEEFDRVIRPLLLPH